MHSLSSICQGKSSIRVISVRKIRGGYANACYDNDGKGSVCVNERKIKVSSLEHLDDSYV